MKIRVLKFSSPGNMWTAMQSHCQLSFVCRYAFVGAQWDNAVVRVIRMLWAELIMLSVLHAVSAHADPSIYPKAFHFYFSSANDNSTHLYRMHMQSPRQLLSWFRCQWLWGCSVPTSTMKFIHQCHHRTSVIGSYTDLYEVPITPSSYTWQKAYMY